jgi:hypothetical protein
MTYKIPKTFRGQTEEQMEQAYNEIVNRTPDEKPSEQVKQEEKTSFDNPDFIYVPSINLYVAKQRTLVCNAVSTLNWDSYQEKLHSENSKMLTILEFREFLNYTKTNFPEIYSEITEVRNPWRGEWLDANFKIENKELFVCYHVFENNKIIFKREKLDKGTLIKKKTSGISLDSWLNNTNSTNQGLPKDNINSGNLHYWCSMKNHNSVARFYVDSDRAYLNCNTDSFDGSSHIGVRAVKEKL